MRDAEYVFNKEIRDKKRIARGARNKVNGIKSQKCTLPYELMTRKEIKAMSGEVSTWRMNQFYSWDEFKDMPADLKVEYLNKMIDGFDISVSNLANDLFNISDAYFRKSLIRWDIYDKIHLRHGTRTKKENIDKFQTAILKSFETPVSDIPEETKDPNPQINLDGFIGNISSCTVYMDGFDRETIEFLERKYRGKKIEVIVSVNLANA